MRYPKCNLHTHTCFCDGKNTPREMVLSAIDQGMETLGFSGHSYTPFCLSATMLPEEEALYRKEVLALKEEFADQICILLGIEQDICSAPIREKYDFVIGSVHYLHVNGEYCEVDESAQRQCSVVQRHFGGDFYRFVSAYYEAVAQVADKTECDIVGHFDLVTKFNEGNRYFDESDPRYLKAALDALDVLLEKDVLFEINTGAISRGYRRTPYPGPILLHRIAEKRGRVTFSADAHAKEGLLCGFEDSLKLARSAGLGSITMRTKEGWREFAF